MRAIERFLHYATVHTTSDSNSKTTPSTGIQFDLANGLVNELHLMGIDNAFVDDRCYVYACIPATPGYEAVPRIGFIAHMDTTDDYNGKNVRPQIHENYDGGDVPLGNSGKVLRVSDFPTLKSLKGRTLITTDGTTLLGADDKAGVAEIMTIAEELINSPLPHGKVCIGFTPDEEVGRGADYFDVERFGADFAYTLDGSIEGEVVHENFNAADCTFEIHGVSVHPGKAKNIMVNALLVAMEINGMLPSADIPRHTQDYEGFFHLTHMQGCVEHATLDYIIRDHDAAIFEARLHTLQHIADIINEHYGQGTVILTIRRQYRNMAEIIEQHRDIVDTAVRVTKELGIPVHQVPIRGGTDGSRLSFMGLPCPNLGTGGFAFHGPFEHITAEGMDSAVAIAVGIVREYAGRSEHK